jgi:hypothetical protein
MSNLKFPLNKNKSLKKVLKIWLCLNNWHTLASTLSVAWACYKAKKLERDRKKERERDIYQKKENLTGERETDKEWERVRNSEAGRGIHSSACDSSSSLTHVLHSGWNREKEEGGGGNPPDVSAISTQFQPFRRRRRRMDGWACYAAREQDQTIHLLVDFFFGRGSSSCVLT